MKTKLPNEISNLNTWIHQNEIKIKRNVDKTNCNKWKFWYISKESPLPCCCPKRTSECIFLEMYNKLFYSMQLQKKESEFADALIVYERIQLNLKAVMEWVILYYLLEQLHLLFLLFFTFLYSVLRLNSGLGFKV